MEDGKLIFPKNKVALIIGIGNYSYWKPPNEMKNLKHPVGDAIAMKKLFESFDYNVISNIDDQGNEIPEKSTKYFVDQEINKYIRDAKDLAAKKQNSHIFVYFSGHGVISGDYQETCGLDGEGKLIPFESLAKKLSLIQKSLSIFFLDCCRQLKENLYQGKTSYQRLLNPERKGIVIVKYACEIREAALSFQQDTNSKATLDFIRIIKDEKNSKKDIRLMEILEGLQNYQAQWAKPQKKWGTWLVFNSTGIIKMDRIHKQKAQDSIQNLSVIYQNLEKRTDLFGPDKTKDYDDKSYYVGQMKDGKKHGFGKFYFPPAGQYAGCRYEGKFLHDKMNGFGIIYDKFNRKQLESDFVDNSQHGDGILFHASNFSGDKVQYEGKWEDGLFHGRGNEFYVDASVKYSGYYKEGLYDGFGFEINKDERYTYTGSYKNGEFEGNGILTTLDLKVIYKGEFSIGKYHGVGKLYNTQGIVIFDGELRVGRIIGQGKHYNEEGKISFDGEFIEYKGDLIDEDDKLVYNVKPRINLERFYKIGKLYDMKDNKTKDKLKYDGELKDFKFHGKGTSYYPTGQYQGEFKEGLKDGFGKVIHETGVVLYEGYYKKDKIHMENAKLYTPIGFLEYEGNVANGEFEGKGKLYDKEGKLAYSGEFKKGLKDGYGTQVLSANGEEYKGYWKNDKQEGRGIYRKVIKDVSTEIDGWFTRGRAEGRAIYTTMKGIRHVILNDGEVILEFTDVNDQFSVNGGNQYQQQRYGN